MKRPPGLWILLSAGLLWLSLEEVDGVRATSLIFAKTSTTTSTTTPAPSSEAAGDEEGDTTEPVVDANSTKPNLTGLPQLDYVWDPNLPKELNGYNLSDYPFYERVPEDIDFKCDGLHDGFYASVKHKCQVYHHCLFGVRYDFLCANYTAFDQTLFNCNFVSNVDCQNSKRFWHRNDELYVTKSTTTTPAPIVYAFYTPPTNLYLGAQRTRTQGSQLRNQQPQQPSAEASGQVEQPTVAQQPQPQPQVVYIDPGLEPKRRQRPQRRRPVYDYYDDYEERPRRPRPRRPIRPLYYDDDYEEDRYDRRGGTRRRRPYERRPMMRENERRRKYDYYDDEDYLEEEYDDLVLDKKKPSRKRKFDDDDDIDETRRDRNRSQPKPKPRLGVRRPPSEDYEDELQKSDKSDTSTRLRKSNKEGTYKGDENQSLAKPAGLYDRRRPSPKINVPRNSYKTSEEISEDSTVATTTTAATTTTPRPSTSRFNARKRPKQTEAVPDPDNMSTSTTSEAVTVLRKFKRPLSRKPVDSEEERPAPAPVRVKVPIRLTKLKEKTTEPTQLDTLYDTYDVTLNEASPVADLTPLGSYPTGIDVDEYAFRYSKERR